ncbi:hypothetical protein EXIGLDRAFT_778179 [Exidia glandulosa HHB12029]|uniref:Uncharacterized protein n=1 Tax=Exidia glandulosa HHB12029 TaxID=1314781 RepID=A0A165CNM2_EXIGL|nr:hypothetical protein EXIGLDRAFT_778179 [Exidia glandulosa HHB12029]
MERSVLDEKPLRDGSFVIISLDPIASVAALDAQAAHEASLIKSGKYLALLKNVAYFALDCTSDKKTSTVELLLVGRGLPTAPASWASIPIFPASSHPENGRPAVHTTLPLPWPDCHVYSMAEHDATVSRIHTHPEAGPSLLNDHDRIEVQVMAGSDSRRFWRLQPPTLRMRTPRFEHPDGSEEPMEISAPAYASDSGFYMFLPSPPKLRMPQMRLHVELWVGVDGVTDLAHPDTFASGVGRLQE